MAASRYCKLIMITENNNNKYYSMSWDGVSSEFQVEYGRVELTKQTESYPISRWESIKASKIKKGYKDVTEFVSVAVQDVEEEQPEISLADKVSQFLALMKSYTDNLVKTTYSVKAQNVTRKQLDTAQSLIDKIKRYNASDVQQINNTLLELYAIIPRYISNVRVAILPHIDLANTLVQEQSNLDAMSFQVKSITPSTSEQTKKKNTLQDSLGIQMEHITQMPSEIQYILNGLAKSGRQVLSVYKVHKEEEYKKFQQRVASRPNKATRILIHGTRPSSVIPIIEQGLKIRPTGNFVASGKIFGNGNYFANEAEKSLGYVGNQVDKVFLIYEVHTGNFAEHYGWSHNSSSSYEDLVKKQDCDSLYVRKGNGLRNDEIIVYTESQQYLKYILHIK